LHRVPKDRYDVTADEPGLDHRVLHLANRRLPKRSELIAQDLVEYIIDSKLPAGTRLPGEKQMIEQLGVGRTTLREALRILETRGVVTIRSGPGGGPVVRTPDPTDLTDSLTLILQFQRATLVEVLDARAWLEPTVARMAARQITKVTIRRLREINGEMEDAIDGNEQSLMAANERFHRLIAASAGDRVIQALTETLLTVADTGASELKHSREFKRVSVAGHEMVVVALEKRDGDAAEAAMRAHVLEGKTRRVEENRSLMNRPLRWVP
jgi:GntR family transcriptional regulator, transcriptional repressor for pyruvate dehydrogenase complex